jgi:hypothetical protein
MGLDVHRVYGALLRGFRRRRMARFAAEFEPKPGTRILDVGGSAFNWRLAEIVARITLLNLTPPRDADTWPAHLLPLRASGTHLPHSDRAFDIAFSNSVIEHLGTFERQQRFAEQLRRVGRGLWVQTPARGFPFEPHLLTPFVHYLPMRIQARLLRRFSVWGWLTRPSPDQVERFVSETRLLSHREMRRLFPDCEIRRERFLGLTKAYVAVRKPGTSASSSIDAEAQTCPERSSSSTAISGSRRAP